MSKHIVFWLGRAPEPWDHHTAIDQGIGGSELAALRLTSELAAMGYQVSVYADIMAPDPSSQNPRWLPYEDASFAEVLISCDLLVSSRCPTLGMGAADRKKLGKPTWLWMHDLHVGSDWGNVLGTCFDKVICLSRFAKERFCQYYPRVDSHTVDIIPNGITPELFTLLPKESLGDKHVRLQTHKEPLSCIWSSCPDRGLDRVLDVWPSIVQAFPGAKLSIFGNFNTWLRRIELFGTSEQRKLAHVLTRQFLASMMDPKSGVRFWGQAGQIALANAWRGSHLWFYPTSFEETSCIIALEAQASGTKIVCTAMGSLPETAPYARFLPSWEDNLVWKSQATSTIIDTMQDPLYSMLDVAYARVLSWSLVASLWDTRIVNLEMRQVSIQNDNDQPDKGSLN